MSIFDIFKSKKTITVRGLGDFTYTKKLGWTTFRGNVKSIIMGTKIEICFPCKENADEVSDYQVEYFRKIEKDWADIKSKIEAKLNPEIKIDEFRDVSIMIPDYQSEEYDCDAEIGFQNQSEDLFSAIMKGINVDEIIYI
jgi:hypothetical protein